VEEYAELSAEPHRFIGDQQRLTPERTPENNRTHGTALTGANPVRLGLSDRAVRAAY